MHVYVLFRNIPGFLIQKIKSFFLFWFIGLKLSLKKNSLSFDYLLTYFWNIKLPNSTAPLMNDRFCEYYGLCSALENFWHFCFVHVLKCNSFSNPNVNLAWKIYLVWNLMSWKAQNSLKLFLKSFSEIKLWKYLRNGSSYMCRGDKAFYFPAELVICKIAKWFFWGQLQNCPSVIILLTVLYEIIVHIG